MILIQDSREQDPLAFPVVKGVEVKVEAMPVADYTALHDDPVNPLAAKIVDTSVIERKSLGDLFHAFTSQYEAERTKILRARDLHLTYILAIESSFSEVLKGHAYWKDGEVHESRKSGLAMVRQLCTIQRHYPWVQVWYCTSRKEMAMRIQEHFLAQERVKEEQR